MSIPMINYPQARPYTNVQPFTVRDGATHLLVLESLRTWLRDVLVPHIDTEVSELATSWAENQEAAQEAFETAVLQVIELLATATTDIDAKVAEVDADRIAAELARDAAEAFASDAAAIQDANIAGFVNAGGSATRIALNALFATKATQETVETGRLSADQMAEDWATKAVETIVESGRLAAATLDARFDAKADTTDTDPVIETVNNGRLSEDAINELFTDIYGRILTVERDGEYPVGMFARLQQGMRDRLSINTRVVILGDSHAVGGYTTHYEQGMMQRLAYRAGAKTYRMLDSAASPVPAGMQWYSGALGGTVSSNYWTGDRVADIAIVNPQYVLHYVGSNDHANNIAINTYKANLLAAISAIDAVAPDTIHVLIHGQDRKDIAPVIPWTAYGVAMGEVAASAPNKRIYIDTADAFGRLGLGTDNYAGMVMVDNTHMANVGHKYMADILSQYMGIPMETRYDKGSDIRAIPQPTKKTYNAVEVQSEIDIVAAPYPRQVQVMGHWYVNAAGGPGGEFAPRLWGTASIGQSSIRIGTTTARSVSLATSIYLPPGVTCKFGIVVVPPPSSNIDITGGNDYFRAWIEVQAI